MLRGRGASVALGDPIANVSTDALDTGAGRYICYRALKMKTPPTTPAPPGRPFVFGGRYGLIAMKRIVTSTSRLSSEPTVDSRRTTA